MSDIEKKLRLSVGDIAELVRMVEMERTNYPEDSLEERVVLLDGLRRKLLFELANPP